MKKKILATLLCVCIVLMLLPMMSIPAFAAPEDYTLYFKEVPAGSGTWNLYKGDTTIVYDGQPTKWSVSGATLKLNNFNFETTANIALSGESGSIVGIELTGDNTIISTYNGASSTAGINVPGSLDGSVSIEGDGSLAVTGGTSTSGSSYGIAVRSVSISGDATVTATGGTAATNSYGVSAEYLHVSDSADVTVIGGTATSESSGIYIGTNFGISGGTLTAIGNTYALSGTPFDKIVPAGYKYYVNTTTDPSVTELIGDGSTTEIESIYKYAKIVSVLPGSEKDITAFTISGQSGSTTISGTTIAVTMPFGTDVTALTPAITLSTGASVSPTSGTAQDFTSPVTYTVTAADASTKAYTVTVTVAPATAPDAPQTFTATPGNGKVALSWAAPAGDGGSAITKYEVSSDNGGTWTDASTSTAHTFTGLTSGTAYTFKVRAVNAIGNGAEATATATPTSGSSSGSSSSGGGSGSAKIIGGTTTSVTPPASVEQPQNTNQNNNQTDNQNVPQTIIQQMDFDESKLIRTITIISLISGLVGSVIGGAIIGGSIIFVLGRKK
jgi:Fibronectin type III domain.